MKKEFVPYDLAVKLKDLGFDGLCLCHYHYGNILRSKIVSYVEGDCLKLDKFDKSTPAPLWQQAFDWFREKYGYSSIIPFNGGEHYYWWITECNSFGLDINSIDTHAFTTYEQARHACLEKLIELIQNKNDRSI